MTVGAPSAPSPLSSTALAPAWAMTRSATTLVIVPRSPSTSKRVPSLEGATGPREEISECYRSTIILRTVAITSVDNSDSTRDPLFSNVISGRVRSHFLIAGRTHGVN